MFSHYLEIFMYALVLLPPRALGTAAAEGLDPSATYRAPLLQPGIRDNRSVEDTYIVKFFKGHTLEQHYTAIGSNLSTSQNLIQSFNFLPGYHARLDKNLLEQVRRDTGVQYVEQDHLKQYDGHRLEFSHNVHKPKEHGSKESNTIRRWAASRISYPPWHLAAMTASRRIRFGSRAVVQPAYLMEGVGKGVDIYIADSGIRLTHKEFRKRAKNFQDSPKSPFCNGETASDLVGHGTAVASSAAGISLGMARYANIINVKVMCGKTMSASESAVVGAADAITAQHVSRRDSGDKDFRGSIMNLSFGSYLYSDAEADALAAARKEGVVLVAAAGNDYKQAVAYPCGYDSVICVAATNSKYKIWKRFGLFRTRRGSNYGPDVTIFAPGQDIEVASFEGDKEANVVSGTSVASPLVAGTVATWMSYENLQNDVDTVATRLQENALKGVLEKLPGGSPNVFANNGIRLTPPVGRPNQLPYIGAPLEEAAGKNSESNSATTQGGLSSYTTVTSTPTYVVSSSSGAVLPEPSFVDDCGPEIAVLQWKDFTTTVTIDPPVSTSS